MLVEAPSVENREPTELELRAVATQATEQRFRDKPFDWSKSATCIHLMRYHAAQMGHKLPVVPRFRTALGARKALAKEGFESLPDLMDHYFARIPPSFTRVGDMIAVEGTDSFHSMMVRGGTTMFLGWHPQADVCTIVDTDLSFAVGAWRL